MKVEKKLVFLSVALAAVCLLQNVHAAPTPIPGGDKVLQASLLDVPFNALATMLAEVDSYVYQYTSGDYAGDYLYTYLVTCKSIYSLSFFSVATEVGAAFHEVGYESGGVEPILWVPTGSPPQSVGALFADAISYNEDSALLWFVSDGSHQLADASVIGSKGVSQYSAGNQLYSPIPEPATLVMLGIGSLCLIGRKRK